MQPFSDTYSLLHAPGIYLAYFFILLIYFYFLFTLQFHWLIATVHIADTACRAAIIHALVYYFKFKPTFLTNKNLTGLQLIAIHFISPRYT